MMNASITASHGFYASVRVADKGSSSQGWDADCSALEKGHWEGLKGAIKLKEEEHYSRSLTFLTVTTDKGCGG